MSYPAQFLSMANFELAFTRVVRGANKEYKTFYRHLFSSYNLAVRENLADLIDDVRTGRFEPDPTTLVYQPKQSGVLRPLTLLSLRDLILYQAVMNYVARRFEHQQSRYALKKSFGALFAGKSSPFFYRSWRVCYREYNRALSTAFKSGNRYLADFDLVSFFELIDHNLLRKCMSRRISNADLLDLLFGCLEGWTADAAGDHVRHGVPQGPEPSAFLAECFLFHFDALKLKRVRYIRYVDDIRLLAKDEVPLRRALLRLDLCSKELGLVPQAQKIECRRVKKLREILKSVPSGLASAGTSTLSTQATQKQLRKMLRQSMMWKRRRWTINDVTRFRFALNRLKPRRDILQRIAGLLVQRPDCSWVLASYVRKFPKNAVAADVLLNALRRDPTYDAAAANYIDAMDVCEPTAGHGRYRRVIQTANKRSEEKSIQLRIASLAFRGRRMTAPKAADVVSRENDPRVRGMLIHRLFADPLSTPFNVANCRSLLEREVSAQDPDLARYAAGLLVGSWPWTALPPWRPRRTANRSVKLLLLALGLRRRAPRKLGVLDVFFKQKMRIGIRIAWRKALRSDCRDAERRCLRLQRLQLGDRSAWVLMLDTLNEILLYSFSRGNAGLKARFQKLSGKNHHPDLGAWLNEPPLASALPKNIQWWRDVHSTRVKADLAHAKAKKTGIRTRPVDFRTADALWKRAQAAWAELIGEWVKFL